MLATFEMFLIKSFFILYYSIKLQLWTSSRSFANATVSQERPTTLPAASTAGTPTRPAVSPTSTATVATGRYAHRCASSASWERLPKRWRIARKGSSTAFSAVCSRVWDASTDAIIASW